MFRNVRRPGELFILISNFSLLDFVHLHQVFLFWWGAACGAIVRYNVLGFFVIYLLKIEGGYYVLIEGHLQ